MGRRSFPRIPSEVNAQSALRPSTFASQSAGDNQHEFKTSWGSHPWGRLSHVSLNHAFTVARGLRLSDYRRPRLRPARISVAGVVVLEADDVADCSQRSQCRADGRLRLLGVNGPINLDAWPNSVIVNGEARACPELGTMIASTH